jgi:hypothetical protein
MRAYAPIRALGVAALCIVALSACNHHAATLARASVRPAPQDACSRLAGAWTSDNVGNRIQVEVHRRANQLVWHQFVFLGNTEATEETTFFASCADGQMKTGTYWGDAVYDKRTDTVAMHGREFNRNS